MNALPQTEILPSQSLRKHRQHRHRSRSHQAIAFEASLKILVHIAISIGALAAMNKLMPYQQVQMDKLREIRLRVQETETRVNQLSRQLSHYFDSHQTKHLMQEQSYRVDPNQRRIIWVNTPALSASKNPPPKTNTP